MSDCTILIKDGSLYLSSDVCARFFDGLHAIVLLRRDEDLCILPVRHAAAGGYLLKVRNIAGDRVVHAPDFFRDNNCPARESEFSAAWSSAEGALIVAGALRFAN
ncbi:hypothetical protein [Bradyrhizobium centrosematis]|uniref:hypothetical protein n=1 Tax=Bradyrhizobium centrosematis TaxID=1300039 RepID=UPI00388F6A47